MGLQYIKEYYKRQQYQEMQNAYAQEGGLMGMMGGMQQAVIPQRQTNNSDDSEKLLLLTEEV